MKMNIKQLQQYGEVFVPQTSAEAVVVNTGTDITTLDKVLQTKVDTVITPAGSGLTSLKSNNQLVIIHSNSITPNDTATSVKIQYDSRGHIVQTEPTAKLTIVVNNKEYSNYNGDEKRAVLFGDDFKIDDDLNITLRWNNL